MIRILLLMLVAVVANAGDYEIFYLKLGGQFYGLGGCGGKLILSWGAGFWVSPIPDRPFVAAVVYWPLTVAILLGTMCILWWLMHRRSVRIAGGLHD